MGKFKVKISDYIKPHIQVKRYHLNDEYYYSFTDYVNHHFLNKNNSDRYTYNHNHTDVILVTNCGVHKYAIDYRLLQSNLFVKDYETLRITENKFNINVSIETFFHSFKGCFPKFNSIPLK